MARSIQLDERLGPGQPAPASVVHAPGDPADVLDPARGARLRAAEDLDLFLHCAYRQIETGLQQLEDVPQVLGVAGLAQGPAQIDHRVAVVDELAHLDHEPPVERLRPADVGPAVEVVADPARDRHQPGPELQPAVGPDLARHLEDDPVDPDQGVPRAGDGFQ